MRNPGGDILFDSTLEAFAAADDSSLSAFMLSWRIGDVVVVVVVVVGFLGGQPSAILSQALSNTGKFLLASIG